MKDNLDGDSRTDCDQQQDHFSEGSTQAVKSFGKTPWRLRPARAHGHLEDQIKKEPFFGEEN